MAFYLEPLHDGGRQIVLDKAVVLIGRQAECDVILNDSRKVSRKHCCIAQVNDKYLVRDLASMNGVRVNGERIDREAPLEVGDEISFGDVRYILRDTKANPMASGSFPPAKAAPPDADPSEEAIESAPDLPAAEKPAPKPQQPKAYREPVNISQKFPVPIAEDDEDVDFAVEPSIQLDRLPSIAAGIADAEDDVPPAADAEPSDDIILLDDSGNPKPNDASR